MLASLLKDKKVCLIESNSDVGAKIKVSGGAKCNITNKFVSSDNYLAKKEFVEPILDSFTSSDMLDFCKKNSLITRFDEKIVKGTYFCKTSKDVISMFKKLTTTSKLYLNTKVVDIDFVKNDSTFLIKTNSSKIQAKKVVVASGGLSFTTLGASSLAFDIAKKFNHTLSALNPALVGFTVQKDQFWFKNLSGISAFVQAKVEHKTFEGNILFAHKGITGPVILNASLYWKKGKMSLNFLPNKKIKSFLKSNKKASLGLPLAKRFINEFLSSQELEDKALSSYSKEEIQKLELLNNYEFSPAGNFGYSKAEVTKGGIQTDEINAYSMESLKQDGLYFLGECLDVTGELGGYNFQFAFSSAYTCAKELNTK